MTFEEAKKIFYENQKVQDEFDFKKVDYLFSEIETIIEDIKDICNEEKKGELYEN